MKKQMDKEIIERVKLITGKNVEFRPTEFDTGTIIMIDDVSFFLPKSQWMDYKRTINYYEIDIVSDLSNVIINKFNLVTNG